MNSKLTAGDRHLLRLCRQGQQADGWAKVSTLVWPLVIALPSELVDLQTTETGGLVRLTDAGNTVLDWS